MPDGPSTPKGEATRRRILDAAAVEFAQSGIAGARVERIVQAASTNKAQLYGYFGNKDGLFDAVILDAADQFATAVPFDGDDLAEWAVRVYDEALVRPDLVRLTAWLRLERTPVGRLGLDTSDWDRKLSSITAAQRAGRVRKGDPIDLMVLVIGMACAWSPVSTVYAASAEESKAEHTRRRKLLRECVRAAVAP